MRRIGVVTFIGAGRMATALATGLLGHGFPRSRLRAVEIQPAAATLFAAATGVKPDCEAAVAVSEAAVVVLAVKPQQAQEALASLCGSLDDRLLLSVVAGVRLAALATWGGATRVIRAMPNLPALIGDGAAAYALADGATRSDALDAEAILATTGYVCRVEEAMLDAVTGLSGSGPAYVFEFIQALLEGGVAAGLPVEAARKLAVHTVIGAARMLLDEELQPGELRDRVATPGGTTVRGLAVLNDQGFRQAVAAAVVAAAARARELGEQR